MRALIRHLSKDALQHLVFPGRFMWRLRGDARAVALTFDDGPHPVHTPAVLDVLARAGVQATFFVIGREVDRHPDVARRIVAEGHTIAGHSYDHEVITGRSAVELRADLERCRAAIARATGADTTLFRPPKGEVSLTSLSRVARAGFTVVHWSKTFSDYRQDGVQALTERIRSLPPVAGDILLLHDQNPYTVEALETSLPVWHAAGLCFRRL
jgi:peptidoglycan/xylan/chitin deacetylase (PgdA/CDA1 family)